MARDHTRNYTSLTDTTRPGSDDTQVPWQKGPVENLNRRARRWLPRDTAVAGLADDAMQMIGERLNSTPRKGLGCRTPAEAFHHEVRRIT